MAWIGVVLAVTALGIALDGDQGDWRQGRYVVPSAQLRGKAMAVVGAPGAGKTVTLLRLALPGRSRGPQGVRCRLQGDRPPGWSTPHQRLAAGPTAAGCQLAQGSASGRSGGAARCGRTGLDS